MKTRRVCLPKAERDKLAEALYSKKITIQDLYAMTSKERNAALAKYVGDDMASVVNGKFEQAMMSRQKKAMADWIRNTTSAKDPIRRDMLKKVDRIQEVLSPTERKGFLEDLAEMKLGIKVTEEEAANILQLKTQIDELKVKIDPDEPKGSVNRIAYGLAVDNFKNFVGELKLSADTLTMKERLNFQFIGRNLIDFAGLTKSLIATLDNSFIGRQGIKTLLAGNYKIWGDTLVESFKLFGKELFAEAPKGLFATRNDAVISALRADIYSRPNALNGKYTAAKNGYGLGQFHEEAFPTSIPSRIPLLGRVFKASETAFTGSALKMRADLADAVIAAAEKNGVDMLDEKQASAFGSLVTSMTGRGELTTFAAAGKEINAIFFAPRFLKANFNTITAHTFDRTMTPAARKMAAMNTLKIAASITTILSVAKMIDPDSVDFDPRSTNFGKIKVGGHRYDITGGMNGLVVLGSRIVPTFHNGEFGFWTKSASSGKYTKMSVGDFGEQTALDTFENFFEGKLSPAAGALRDVWKGQKFSGEKPTFVNTTLGLIIPISAQILQEELKKGSDDILLVMLAESFGFSGTSNTFTGTSKKWKELEAKVGTEKMNEALKMITERFNERADKLKESSSWKKMTNEEQADALQKIKDQETDRVLGRYGI